MIVADANNAHSFYEMISLYNEGRNLQLSLGGIDLI